MDDALRDAFMVKMSNLLAEDEVLEERRASESGFQRILVIGNRHTLVRSEHLASGVDALTLKRSVEGLWLQRGGTGLERLIFFAQCPSPGGRRRHRPVWAFRRR